MNAFLDGKRLTGNICFRLSIDQLRLLLVYNRTQEATSQLHDNLDTEEMMPHLNIVDQFVCLLLAIFLEAGLIKVRLSTHNSLDSFSD